jgi:hypothetical protein
MSERSESVESSAREKLRPVARAAEVTAAYAVQMIGLGGRLRRAWYKLGVEAYCKAGCPHGFSNAGLNRWIEHGFKTGVFPRQRRWVTIRPWMFDIAVRLLGRRK